MNERIAKRHMLFNLRDRFRDVLIEAAKHRNERDGIVQTRTGPECEWAEYERSQLLAAVNAERSKRRMPLATVEEIRHADYQASGHFDYADKVALYCAEIAMGIERKQY
jgi:hypothetical protein